MMRCSLLICVFIYVGLYIYRDTVALDVKDAASHSDLTASTCQFPINNVHINYDFESSYVETNYSISSINGAFKCIGDLAVVSDYHVLEVSFNNQVLQKGTSYTKWQYFQWGNIVVIDGNLLAQQKGPELTIGILSILRPTQQPSGNVQSLTLTRCASVDDSRNLIWHESTRYSITLSGYKENYTAMLASGIRTTIPKNANTAYLNRFRMYKGDATQRSFVSFEEISRSRCIDIFIIGGKLLQHQLNSLSHSGSSDISSTNVADSSNVLNNIELVLWAETEENLRRMKWAADSIVKIATWLDKSFGRDLGIRTYNIVSIEGFNNEFYSRRLHVTRSSFYDVRSEYVLDSAYLSKEMKLTRNVLREWISIQMPNAAGPIRKQLTGYFVREYTTEMFRDGVFNIIMINKLHLSTSMNDAVTEVQYVAPSAVDLYITLLGRDGFLTGLKSFFQEFADRSPTIKNLDATMEKTNNFKLKGLSSWFELTHRPVVTYVEDYFDEGTKSFTFTLSQQMEQPLSMPIRVIFYSQDVNDKRELFRTLIHFKRHIAKFSFSGFNEKPLVSIFRDLAPVRFVDNRLKIDFLKLMHKDQNSFSRWNAGQRYATRWLVKFATEISRGAITVGNPPSIEEEFVRAYQNILNDNNGESYLLKYYMTKLPTRHIVESSMILMDPNAAHQARLNVMRQLRSRLLQELHSLMKRISGEGRGESYHRFEATVGARTLRAGLMTIITSDYSIESARLAYTEALIGSSLSDHEIALKCISNIDSPERENAFKEFYQKWKHDEYLLGLWYRIRAQSDTPRILDELKVLREDILHGPLPLRIQTIYLKQLLNGLQDNVHFHRSDGSGYKLFVDTLLTLRSEEQIEDHFVQPFLQWNLYVDELAGVAREQLVRIRQENLFDSQTSRIIDYSIRKKRR